MTDRRLHELFERQVERTPHATAVIAGTTRLTYRELNNLANGIAHTLVAAGSAPGALVGVCLDRDHTLIASLIAIHKTGGAYVPLDPAYPPARLEYLTTDAGLSHTVTNTRHHDLVKALKATPVVVGEGEGTDAADGGSGQSGGTGTAGTAESGSVDAGVGGSAGPVHNLGVGGSDRDAAYVVYTSGSTGQPKGVVIEHRSAVNLMDWATGEWATGEWATGDRAGGFFSRAELAGSLAAASVAFDFSVVEIFPALLTGGTVIVAANLLELPTLAARDEVTMVCGPPSGLRALLRHPLPASVRTVNSGGEAMNRSLVRDIFDRPGVERVTNLYGPSEHTTLSHAYPMDRATAATLTGPPPIGPAVAGATARILAPDGTELPDGDTGELWLSGPGIARGYLNQPELTAERFPGGEYRTGDLAHRHEGVFHYAGRLDDQVKVRGFRVEPAEIEHALTAHPGVHHAVLTTADDTLIAYVEPAPGAQPTVAGLRDHLAALLPAHLVPTHLVVLDRIPLTPGGKADRAALPGVTVVPADHTLPGTPTERHVAAVVTDVLRAGTPVGIHDNFFHIGGHSLTAAHVVARLSQERNSTVPLAAFLTNPTVRELAAHLDSTATKNEASPLVRHPGRTEFPLLESQWYMWMAPKMWGGGTNTTGVHLRLTGLTDVAPLRRALDGIVARHEVMRTVVEERGEQLVAIVRPPAPVPVTELDLRALNPAAAARRVSQLGEEAVQHRFDLAADVPLILVHVVWTADAQADLVVIVDHFAFDGYSIGVFAEELATGIDAALAAVSDPTPPPALQVGDFALVQDAGDPAELDRMRTFWSGELDGANSPNLPGTIRTKGPVHGDSIVRPIGPDLTGRLSDLQADCGVTRFVLFASALGIVLDQRLHEPVNLLGVISALRDRPGVDRVIGPLDAMMPLRVDVGAGKPTFRTLTDRVAERTRLSLAHQDLGIGEILKLVDPDRHPGLPLIPVFLSMQPATMAVTTTRDRVRLSFEGEIDAGVIFCDLAVLVNETSGGMVLHFTYDNERFTPPEVEGYAEHLLSVLATAAQDPDLPIEAYPLGDRHE